ncbi:MAG TPA: hypothetical protein VHB27_03375, partial [Rhodopila sp.]|uniref:tetratricopeptide repeat protein n=1 Tax=Rhodopila sp. TaxID=2480087 RepID=UPI002CD6AA19
EAEVEALMAGYKPGSPLPGPVEGLLRRINAKDPKQTMALWYLGLIAAQDHRPDEARQHWQALAAELPAGSPDRKLVEEAISTLSDKGTEADQGSGADGADKGAKSPAATPSTTTESPK